MRQITSRCVSFLLLTLMATIASGGDDPGRKKIARDLNGPRHALAAPKEITPTDVFNLVSRVQGDIELIRLEMGKPRSPQLEIQIAGAQPREVFFQARTLFFKSNRLAFEQTRERVSEIPIRNGTIKPAHVLEVVQAAQERIRRVKEKLGITESLKRQRPSQTKTTTDVFLAIVHTNRQLNALLEHRFVPSDVYRQVQLAVNYSNSLLKRFPATETEVGIPPFERQKRPADVFQRLVACFGRVRQIAQRSGISVLHLRVGDTAMEQVTPSDVYEIATLIVSELTYLHSMSDGAKPPARIYYPGRKFPSHVYQLAGLLEAQLGKLQKQVDAKPSRLIRKTRRP